MESCEKRDAVSVRRLIFGRGRGWLLQAPLHEYSHPLPLHFTALETFPRATQIPAHPALATTQSCLPELIDLPLVPLQQALQVVLLTLYVVQQLTDFALVLLCPGQTGEQEGDLGSRLTEEVVPDDDLAG